MGLSVLGDSKDHLVTCELMTDSQLLITAGVQL